MIVLTDSLILILNLETLCQILEMHQIYGMSVFSWSMGNELDRGTNKLREELYGYQAICLFRSWIHSL